MESLWITWKAPERYQANRTELMDNLRATKEAPGRQEKTMWIIRQERSWEGTREAPGRQDRTNWTTCKARGMQERTIWTAWEALGRL